MRPPAKRAKRLPPGMTCRHCGGPVRSLQGYWLGPNEYAVECRAGCWACIDCGGFHLKVETCEFAHNQEAAGPDDYEGRFPDIDLLIPNDDIPF